MRSPAFETSHYPDTLSIPEARRRYFDDNGFGADGGYEAAFVPIAIGPIEVPFPNTKGRARAVKYHDLHHLVTGYRTDFVSETAISAWEIGAGCGKSAAAWLIDLSAMGVGAVRAPRRTFAAFVRGRKSASTFDRPFEPLLAKTVGELKAELHVPAPDADMAVTAGDVLAYGGALAASVAVAIPVVFLGTLVVLPFGLAALAAQKRKARPARPARA